MHGYEAAMRAQWSRAAEAAARHKLAALHTLTTSTASTGTGREDAESVAGSLLLLPIVADLYALTVSPHHHATAAVSKYNYLFCTAKIEVVLSIKH
jgi:hypothetical protein